MNCLVTARGSDCKCTSAGAAAPVKELRLPPERKFYSEKHGLGMEASPRIPYLLHEFLHGVRRSPVTPRSRAESRARKIRT